MKKKFEKSLLVSTIKSTTNDCPICASFEEEEGRDVTISGEKPVLRKREMQREKVLLLQVFAPSKSRVHSRTNRLRYSK